MSYWEDRVQSTILIKGLQQWTAQLIQDGWAAHQITLTFKHIRGSQRVAAIMNGEFERVYGLLASWVLRDVAHRGYVAHAARRLDLGGGRLPRHVGKDASRRVWPPSS